MDGLMTRKHLKLFEALFSNTLENQLDYFNDLQKEHGNGTKIQLGVCKNNSSKILGIVSLNNIDYINRKAEISAVIGEKEGKDIKTISKHGNLYFGMDLTHLI